MGSSPRRLRLQVKVIPPLDEIHPPFAHLIHAAVLLGDAARPHARPEVFQGFRFPDP